MSVFENIRLPVYNNNHNEIRKRIRNLSTSEGLVTVTSEVMVAGKPSIVGVIRAKQNSTPTLNKSRLGNGAIFIYRKKLKFISLPSKLCFDNAPVTDSSKINGIADGTMLNVYFFNNRWNLGSRKTHDVSSKVWRGIDYGTAFKEASLIYPDFSLDKLDKSKTYTILLCHKLLCPTNLDNGLIFISSQKLTDSGITYSNTEDIGLPIYRYYNNMKYGKIISNIGGFTRIERSDEYMDVKSLIYNKPDDIEAQDFADMDYVVLHRVACGYTNKMLELLPGLRNKILYYSSMYDGIFSQIVGYFKSETIHNPHILNIAEDLRKNLPSNTKIDKYFIEIISSFLMEKNNFDIIYSICQKDITKSDHML